MPNAKRQAQRQALGSPFFRLFLGVCASAFFLYLAFRNVTLQQVGQALSAADPFWISLALLCTLASVLLKTIRWRVLLGQPGRGVSFRILSMALISGQMINWLVPARLGDFSRAYTVGGLGPGRVFVFGTVMLEKILDLSCYALLFILLFLLIPLPSWINTSGYVVVGLAVSVTLITVLLAFHRQRLMRLFSWLSAHLPQRIRSFLDPLVRSGLDSLDVLQSPVEVIKLGLWSALIWTSMLITNQIVLLALGIYLPLSAALLIMIALQASISLPNMPGTIGLFEYVCLLALSLFGIPQAQALSYGILLHAVAFLPILILGLLSFSALGLKSQTMRLSEAQEAVHEEEFGK